MKRVLRMKRVLVGITAVAAAVITVGVITAAGFGPLNHVDNKFVSKQSVAQVVAGTPPIPATFASTLGGRFKISFNPDLSKANWRLAVANNAGTITAAHIHCGRAGTNGGASIPLFSGAFGAPSGLLASGMVTNADFPTSTPLMMCDGMTITNVATFMLAMQEDVFYINIHTTAHGGGEARGQLLGHN